MNKGKENQGPNQRMRRVNGILQEAIADECSTLKDPRIGFLTVTGVSTAPDLRNATVYYSVMGDEQVHADTADALEAASSRIRLAVGPQVRLKYLPHLKFEVDPAIEHGRRIETILQNIEGRDTDEA
jgi:ribosome-binding factor A